MADGFSDSSHPWKAPAMADLCPFLLKGILKAPPPEVGGNSLEERTVIGCVLDKEPERASKEWQSYRERQVRRVRSPVWLFAIANPDH